MYHLVFLTTLFDKERSFAEMINQLDLLLLDHAEPHRIVNEAFSFIENGTNTISHDDLLIRHVQLLLHPGPVRYWFQVLVHAHETTNNCCHANEPSLTYQ